MKNILLFFLVCLFAKNIVSQTLLNPSFEINTAGASDQINLSNATFNSMMSNVNAFGSFGNMDIIKSSSWGGGGAQNGTWYVALTGSGTDAIAMTISAPLVMGQTYCASFYDRRDASYVSFPVEVGLSTVNNSFGTTVYTAPAPSIASTWTQRSFTFIAPNNGQYLTVRMAGGSTGNWTHIDNFTLGSSISTLTIVTTPTTICLGGSSTFTVTGSASGYTWTPSSSLSSATGSVVIATPTANTTYVVSSGSGGCLNTGTVSVVVDSPTITVNSGTICAGSSFTMIPGGAISYTYAGGSSVVTPTSTTTYTVRGTSASGCLSNVVTSTVTVIPTPTITVNSGTICPGGSFTLVPGGAVSYTYAGGSAIVSPTTTTTYTVQGTNASGCISNIITSTVTVGPAFTITVNSGTICAGQSFTIIPGGALSYTYAGGSSIVSPTTTTTYTVKGSNAFGCLSSTETSTVTVNPAITITVNSGTICPGTSFTMNPSGAITYTYSSGGAIVSPLVNSTYSVQGTDALGCLSTIEISTVTVGPYFPITINSGSICTGNSYTLSPMGALTYTYQGGSAIVTPLTLSTYTVQGTDALGCLSTIETSTVTVISSPTITVNSGVICNGNSFTLTPAGAASFTIAGGSAIVNPSSTTTYTVVGANGGVCVSAPVTSTVTVNPNPTITVNSATICEGKSYTISPTGASSYTYSSSSNIVSPLITTNYSVTGVNSFGCSSTATIVVTVNPLPILTLTGNTVICSGVSTNLVLSGASSYTWTPGKYLNTVNGPSVTATPSISTTHTVFATSALGCITDFAVPISVIETPTLSIAATPTIICEGQSSSLAAFGASTYSWSPSTFISSVSANPTIVNPTVTTTYTLQGFNSAPPHYCVSTKTVQVLVIPKIIASINPVQPLCIGQSTTFKASGGNTYSWTPIDGLSKPTSSITIVQRTVSTSYTVTVSKNGACATQATIDLVVVPVPIVNAGKDTSVQVGESITLIGKGNVTVGFRNMDGTSLDCNYCSSVKVSPENNTCYELRGENSFGCVSVDEVCVNVIKDWNVYIPNAFSPDDDGINEYFVPVGYGIAKMSLTIYDRWGTKIFYEESVEKGWDGKYLGKLSKQDVYVYVVEIKTMEGTITKKTGHLTLLSKVVK